MVVDAPEAATQQRVDSRRRLVDLQRELSSCTDFGEVCAMLASELGALLPVSDRVSIALLEPDGQWLRIHRLLPVAAATSASPPRVRAEGTPLSQTVLEGVGRIVADVRTDSNITFGPVSHDGIRSTVSVPLRIEGRIVGAMNAGSRTVGACDAQTLARLEEVAAVVGPIFFAMEQARAVPPPPAPRARVIELAGTSASFSSMLDLARRAANSDADVLITGETGVGKTALARAMHAWSGRRGPFVTVHLGDLTPTLVESELFGFERGAFTGASASRVGRFESAHGGTIFLDEIGEAPLAIQAKILRVVQDRCLERVGGGRTIDIDVRIIAATSRDLLDDSRRGLFRQDLYYRLGVVPLRVPPLRERGEDLAQLVSAILSRLSRDGRALTLAPAAWAKLRGYGWPGNIRELESVLRRAAILEDRTELVLSDFEGAAERAAAAWAPLKLASAPAAPDESARLETLDEHERAYIEHVLARCAGVIEGATGAARILGVPPSTLRSRMKRLGIEKAAPAKGRTTP